jgi:hypothetical protein
MSVSVLREFQSRPRLNRICCSLYHLTLFRVWSQIGNGSVTLSRAALYAVDRHGWSIRPVHDQCKVICSRLFDLWLCCVGSHHSFVTGESSAHNLRPSRPQVAVGDCLDSSELLLGEINTWMNVTAIEWMATILCKQRQRADARPN